MWLAIYTFFSYGVFFYTMLTIVAFFVLMLLSWRAQRFYRVDIPDDDMAYYLLKGTPLTPAVSVIASAYNEEVTIIDNVTSLLQIKYPKIEIIIVNDASTDDTLKLLIENFKLVSVPFTNTQRVPSKPIKQVYRSTDKRFHSLVVVDKEHGGRKSDGINAGINICTTKYFINTDVDCIIEPMAVCRMMWLVLNSHYPMIGVSATMLMSNGCTIENGQVTEAAVSLNPLPMWQQLEYMRSFLLGKMGWSAINALPNISGGFGLFDTEVVVKSGGYDPLSMAEDMDMLLRMVTYMKNSGQEFRLAQVPQVCCWTEGPFSLKTIYRQRVRWARGLCEIISAHRKLFFNSHYGPIGSLTLPYIFIFEFIAPLLEITGIIFMIWLLFIGGINWKNAAVIFSMIYLFAITMTTVVLLFDYTMQAVRWKKPVASYAKLLLAGITEPIFFHPLITFCSIIGYWNFLRNTAAVWKVIERKGAKKKKKKGKESELSDTENEADNTADNQTGNNTKPENMTN